MNAALNFINLPLYKQANQQVLIVNSETTSNNSQYSNSSSNIANTTAPKSQDASNQFVSARAMANALNSQINQSTADNSTNFTLNKLTNLTDTDNNCINRTSTNHSAENHQGNEAFI